MGPRLRPSTAGAGASRGRARRKRQLRQVEGAAAVGGRICARARRDDLTARDEEAADEKGRARCSEGDGQQGPSHLNGQGLGAERCRIDGAPASQCDVRRQTASIALRAGNNACAAAALEKLCPSVSPTRAPRLSVPAARAWRAFSPTEPKLVRPCVSVFICQLFSVSHPAAVIFPRPPKAVS